MKGMARSAIPPVFLFLFSFSVCAVFSMLTDTIPLQNDAAEYFRLSENVAVGKGISLDGSRPYCYRAPLFSALLGGWFFVTGHPTVVSARIYQSFCIALSVALSYYLALAVFNSRRTALGIASILAIHPSLVTSTAFVLQEPTLLLFTTIAMWFTLCWFQVTGKWASALVGTSWGVATLGKSVTMFVPMLLLLFWFFRRRKDLFLKPAEVLLAMALFAAVVAPWTIRNYQHFHRLILVNDQSQGLLEWNVAHADPPPREEQKFPGLFLDVLKPMKPPEIKLSGQRFIEGIDRESIGRTDRIRRLWGFVRENWKYFLALRLRNMIYFSLTGLEWWIHSGRMKSLYENRAAMGMLLVFHFPLYAILLWRFFHLVRGDLPVGISFLEIFYICYWGVYILAWGDVRYSLPVYPILLVLAPWEKLFSSHGGQVLPGSSPISSGGRAAGKSERWAC